MIPADVAIPAATKRKIITQKKIGVKGINKSTEIIYYLERRGNNKTDSNNIGHARISRDSSRSKSNSNIISKATAATTTTTSPTIKTTVAMATTATTTKATK
jgi:hypothetical protein